MHLRDRIKAIRLTREAVASGLTEDSEVLDYVASHMDAGDPGSVDWDKLLAFIMEIVKMILPLLIKRQGN